MPVVEVISENCGIAPAQGSPALRRAGDCSLDISVLKTKSARRSAVQLCQTGRFIGFQGEHLNLRFPALNALWRGRPRPRMEEPGDTPCTRFIAASCQAI